MRFIPDKGIFCKRKLRGGTVPTKAENPRLSITVLWWVGAGFLMGESFKGRTLVSRTRDMGSIPISPTMKSILNNKLIVKGTLPAKMTLDGGRVLYGETYDMLGVTVDSLKYYLFLEYLSRLNPDFRPLVMEADLHASINKSVKDKNERMEEGKRRVRQIARILEILNCKNVKVRLMSELVVGGVKEKVDVVRQLVSVSEKYQKMLAKTVLVNKVTQEKQSGFRYSAEEIGLALSFDIKVGPPREKNYDVVAQKIARELNIPSYHAIYLRPTYPLVENYLFYLNNPEIEKYGLTPYKAGSNKLENTRIVIGKTSLERVEEIVMNAYGASDLRYANPLLDLALIVSLVKGEGEDYFRELVMEKKKLVKELINVLGRLYE